MRIMLTHSVCCHLITSYNGGSFTLRLLSSHRIYGYAIFFHLDRISAVKFIVRRHKRRTAKKENIKICTFIIIIIIINIFLIYKLLTPLVD